MAASYCAVGTFSVRLDRVIRPSVSLPESSVVTRPSKAVTMPIAFCRWASTSAVSMLSEPFLMIARVTVGWSAAVPPAFESVGALPSVAAAPCFCSGAAAASPWLPPELLLLWPFALQPDSSTAAVRITPAAAAVIRVLVIAPPFPAHDQCLT